MCRGTKDAAGRLLRPGLGLGIARLDTSSHRNPFLPTSSNDIRERTGGLVAIEELAGSKMYSGSPARLADLVKLLMEVFQPASDQQLMDFAARTLGHTVKAGGALMAGVVEEQVGIVFGGVGAWGLLRRWKGGKVLPDGGQSVRAV